MWNDDFAERYNAWIKRIRNEVLADYPEYKDNRLEFGEDGTVYVHMEYCAYPMELNGYEPWEDNA